MKNKMMMLTVVGMMSTFGTGLTTFAEETQVTGTINAGTLTMSQPNDVTFEVLLNGQEQTKDLDSIKTKVTDHRGALEGWKLHVSSTNYIEYKDNFQVIIEETEINAEGAEIKGNDDLSLETDLSLATQVKVMADAKASNDYAATLVWNLSPNTADMKE